MEEENNVEKKLTMKERYELQLEEQKKNEKEKVNIIKTRRGSSTDTPSEGSDLKNKWKETVATSKAEEEKKYLARRASTIAAFQETEGMQLIR